ncbi:MAG: 16S rRNA (cytosine(1402)-N(4))-methyltransferase RsmH [Chlorobiales bacterium]|nr:16S rRNA (cytosine(1402)-N(4))-methyltransferase RsmH [Chlorobiales bacterium]
MTQFYHRPVLLEEAVAHLVTGAGVYVDATLGGGGHSFQILNRLKETGHLDRSLLIGIDKDRSAIQAASGRLEGFGQHVLLTEGSFAELDAIVHSATGPDGAPLDRIRGMLFDLGVSSHQIDRPERGFSFQRQGPLDMRMSIASGRLESSLSAGHVVNEYDEAELARIFFEYGEEHRSRQIAKKIVETRRQKSIETTGELAEVIRRCTLRNPVEQTKTLARVFQAIRIEVNGELSELSDALEQAYNLLEPGGRIVVISYHSLEDRVVKTFFKEHAEEDWGPKGVPLKEPLRRATMKLITKKPLLPGEEETRENTRARSAKMRVAEKI